MRTKPIVLAIDFDGVIHDRANPVEGRRMGPPLTGAKEAMEQLTDRGFRVVVHSCVAHTPAGWQAITDWLEYYDIPAAEVTAVKPIADLYVDDRGLHHTSWPSTLTQISDRLGIEVNDD